VRSNLNIRRPGLLKNPTSLPLIAFNSRFPSYSTGADSGNVEDFLRRKDRLHGNPPGAWLRVPKFEALPDMELLCRSA
jgi:hypothetical protein